MRNGGRDTIVKMLYSSGSQTGVRVPLGVREKLEGGTQNVKFTDTIELGGTRIPKG
jgi:hypothetical protein